MDLDRGDFQGDFKNLVEQFSSVLDGLGPGGFSGGFFLKIWLNSSLQSWMDLDRGDFQGDFKNLVEQSYSLMSGRVEKGV
jgi:hypothetical protein